MDYIEQRLDTITSLRRKYGENIKEILAYLDKIKNEVDTIENKDEIIRKLEDKLATAREASWRACGLDLSKLRKGIAERACLLKLNMNFVTCKWNAHSSVYKWNKLLDERGIEVEGNKVRYSRQGIDQVEFLMAPNPGEPLRGLSKIASGGELSRIMLAMKTIFARIDQIPVLVFDEVDTGVSGRAAQAIAEKMSVLSQSCQVFSITHLPQVASFADVHFYIRKEVDQERTFTRVQDMPDAGRIEELARMLGGVEVTETTLHHAGEMLTMARNKKARV